MSNSTCRHPVTGWNNGSHYINTQPDSAIKWKKHYQKHLYSHLTAGYGMYSSPSMCFSTSPTQRTERGSCAESKAHDPFIRTEHLSYRPQSQLTAAARCLPSITALIMPTKAEGALWLVPRLSLSRPLSFFQHGSSVMRCHSSTMQRSRNTLHPPRSGSTACLSEPQGF